MNRDRIFVCVLLLIVSRAGAAIGHEPLSASAATRGARPLGQNSVAALPAVSGNDWRGTQRAARDLQGDPPESFHNRAPGPTADQPVMRGDANSQLAHQQLLAKAKAGGISLYFLGDSITRRWGATDYPDFLAHWNRNFHGWNAGDFGWGGDTTQNILWRLQNGELDGVNPKVIVLLAGTNNIGKVPGDDAKVADVTRGVAALVSLCRAKAPAATIILMGIFPRNDGPVVPTIDRINANLAKLADGKSVRYLNINGRLADTQGKLFDGMTVDQLHPSLKGYQVWVEALRPVLTELLGPPAANDTAPPPTGDPSAKR